MSRLLFALLLTLGGCSKAVETQCVYDADCGELAICEMNGEAGVCRNVECLESTDCAFGDYCAEDKTCASGCGADSDCIAGETCDLGSNTCEPYSCRDTQLDCQIGEFCDNGTCKKDDRGHCEICDIDKNSCAGGAGTCAILDVGGSCKKDKDCGPDEVCDLLQGYNGKVCHTDYCVLTCDPNATKDCPRGFSCVTGLFSNEPNKSYCFADCTYYKENGFL